jgi:hypothetical protein
VQQVRADERRRLAGVFASTEVQGRETAAAWFLAHTNMSSAKICTVLAGIPRDDATRAEWRERLKADQATQPQPAVKANKPRNHGWPAIHAKLAARQGIGKKTEARS